VEGGTRACLWRASPWWKDKTTPVHLRKRPLLTVVLIGVLVGIGICSFAYLLLDRYWLDPLSPVQTDMDQTELILEAFAAYGDKLALSDLPLDVRYGVEQCQAFLQAAMRENQNQYELVVTGVFGDYGTPTAGGTGTTEAVITIVFPDGTRAEMHYYGHHLDVCQEISD
jgi:hypothetical protein